MVLRRALTSIALPLVAIPAVAAAQEAVPVAEPSSVVFPSMGPDGSASQVGGQLQLVIPDGADESLKRIDLNGQIMAPSGIGGYATIGASAIDDEFELGALEAGGIYRVRRGTTDLALRAGVILPTAGGAGEDFPLHLFSTLFARPSDVLTGAPDTTTLRLAFAPSARSGQLVARADVGLDVIVATDNGPDSSFLHVDVGTGYHDGTSGVLLELSNVMPLEHTDDRFHLVALTAETSRGGTTPYVTLSKPFTSEDGNIDIFNVALGVRGRL